MVVDTLVTYSFFLVLLINRLADEEASLFGYGIIDDLLFTYLSELSLVFFLKRELVFAFLVEGGNDF